MFLHYHVLGFVASACSV